jgi:hypothetical protein
MTYESEMISCFLHVLNNMALVLDPSRPAAERREGARRLVQAGEDLHELGVQARQQGLDIVPLTCWALAQQLRAIVPRLPHIPDRRRVHLLRLDEDSGPDEEPGA